MPAFKPGVKSCSFTLTPRRVLCCRPSAFGPHVPDENAAGTPRVFEKRKPILPGPPGMAFCLPLPFSPSGVSCRAGCPSQSASLEEGFTLAKSTPPNPADGADNTVVFALRGNPAPSVSCAFVFVSGHHVKNAGAVLVLQRLQHFELVRQAVSFQWTGFRMGNSASVAGYSAGDVEEGRYVFKRS